MDAFFNSGGDWQFGLQDTVRVLNMLIADAVFIYRVWCVWERRWQFIVLNVLVWLGTLVSSIRILQFQIQWIEVPADYFYLSDLTTWSLATQCLTLSQTALATGLIAFRLWQVDWVAAVYKQSGLLRVVRILVEPGLLYTSLMVCNVATTALGNPGLFVILTLTSPIIGINFSLISIVVGLGISSESRTTLKSAAVMATDNENIGHDGLEWDAKDSVGLKPMSHSLGSAEAV